MHMEQDTESKSVVQSHFSTCREKTLKHIQMAAGGGGDKAQFPQYIFKLKGVKWPLHSMKH